MANWIDATSRAQLPVGNHTVIDTEAGPVALFHLEDGLFAIEDRCSHDGGELACGRVEHGEIICPRHGARFCLRSGAALTPPAYEAIETFPVREKDGMIQINLDAD